MVRKREQTVQGTTHLEGTRLLEVLALEEHRTPHALGESRGGDQRCPVHAIGHPGACLVELFERDGGGFHDRIMSEGRSWSQGGEPNGTST